MGVRGSGLFRCPGRFGGVWEHLQSSGSVQECWERESLMTSWKSSEERLRTQEDLLVQEEGHNYARKVFLLCAENTSSCARRRFVIVREEDLLIVQVEHLLRIQNLVLRKKTMIFLEKKIFFSHEQKNLFLRKKIIFLRRKVLRLYKKKILL